MKWLAAILALLPVCSLGADGRAAELARQIRETTLDPEECYRVRDLNFAREDVRFYLTDGFLLFGKPVKGNRYSAVFVADTEGGDAEMLALAPTRGERMALAANTGSPTLSEHFKVAVMIFTDNAHQLLLEQIRERGEPQKSPERGALLSGEWSPVLRNLASSFEIRLVGDMLAGRRSADGFFYAALSGDRLGNFDVVYDPLSRAQITIGKVAFRENRAFFDVWTSFQSRSFRAGVRKSPPTEFKVGNYRIDAALDPNLLLKVTTKVTVVPSSRLHSLDFELSRRMRVTDAFIDGVPAEVFQRESLRSNLIQGRTGDDVFLLVPPNDFEAGRRYELEFRHEGAVVTDAGNRVYYVGSRSNWYPSVPAQFALFDVTFRYPQDLNLVAAGEVVEQRTEPGLHVVRRRTVSPIRFFGFNLGDYERVSVKQGDLSVEVCANRRIEPSLRPAPQQAMVLPPPGWQRGPRRTDPLTTLEVGEVPPNPAARLGPLASEIADAFGFMAEHFGRPTLPHLTVAPIPGAFGQGFPGLVYLSTLSYLAPAERPRAARSEFQQVFFSEILHAHETAHQWWGNVITAAGYQDEWLMEALANYSALMYLEKRKGPGVLASVLEEYRKHLVAPLADGTTLESKGPLIWGFRLQTSQTPEAWRTIVYEKGTWILHMLRRRIGDERFLRMLGELRRRYEYQGVSTEQFRIVAAGFLPPKPVDPDLEGFFENWVYSTGVPTLRLESSVRGKAPVVRVTATVRQTASPRGFSAYVPVVVQLRGAKPVTKWLETDGEQPVSVELNLRQPPLKVQLDPDGSVLAVKE